MDKTRRGEGGGRERLKSHGHKKYTSGDRHLGHLWVNPEVVYYSDTPLYQKVLESCPQVVSAALVQDKIRRAGKTHIFVAGYVVAKRDSRQVGGGANRINPGVHSRGLGPHRHPEVREGGIR